MIAIPVIFACLAVAWLEGIPDDVFRWVKSFEFAAIEARYKPIADQLATVTSDTLLDESHDIGNAQLQTHSYYTGIVAGTFTRIYGTNRSFNAILDDYVHFLSSTPDWKVDKGDYTVNTSHTAKVTVRVLDQSESPPGPWKKYRTIYKVTLVYGDPSLWDE